MLQLRAARGPTGRLLAKMLKERGLTGGRIKGVVNYGYGEASDLPTLNANAGRRNKYQELVKLDDAGVRTVPFSQSPGDLVAPIFGRKLHHTQGRDIKIYQVTPGLPRRNFPEPSDYYTGLVPKQKEFRVWIFRGKHLATYEKVLDYPARNGRRGRSKEIWNWGNGYAYYFVQPNEVSTELKELAAASITALGLDFGAVDVVLGADHRCYVLEVNTAPGTQGAARQGITSLVNCIERWAKNGFKSRRSE